MNQTGFIPVFTPSQASTDDLEKIFVQRHRLLQDAEDRVRESATTGNKHHLLFVGPRGSGKTHFVSLLVHRLGSDRELNEKLEIAWLNEDETCTNFLDLLLKIYAALAKRYPTRYDADDLEPVYDIADLAEAEQLMQSLLLERLNDRTCLIVVENLDLLFQSIGDEGQKKLRAFLQEQSAFTVTATAQALIDDLTNRNLPFFGFFQTDHLKPLQLSDAIALIGKIADKNGDERLRAFLATPKGRSRVRALHFLSGGNHRVFLVLSQFISRENIEDLVIPFQKMVDEMTPYYQERIRALPPLQRKIVEFLCKSAETVPVKNITKRMLGSTHQTVSKQLQELRSKGYVRSHLRGRESLYEVSEPLMRICVEVKENQNYSPLRLIVDFIRIWYETDELEKFCKASKQGTLEFSYFESAHERTLSEGNLRQKILATDLHKRVQNTELELTLGSLTADFESNSEELLLAVECLMDGNKEDCLSLISSMGNANQPSDLLMRGVLNREIGETSDAISDFSRIISMTDIAAQLVAKALFYRGVTHGQNGDRENAIADYSAIIALENAPVDQVAKALLNRGVTYEQNGDRENAITDYSALIALDDAPVEHVADALLYRGVSQGENRDSENAIADFSAIIALENASIEQVANALYNRGVSFGENRDIENAIADYSAVIALENAPVEHVADALFFRGLSYGQNGDRENEIADYSAVIALENAPVEHVADALFFRGISYRQNGDRENEIADLSAIIALENASIEQVAKALYHRGISYGENGDIENAIADYSAVIALDDAPVERVAEALLFRGVSYGENGDIENEIADYSAVTALDDAPVEHVADALFFRGITYWKNKEIENAIADYSAVIALENAPVERVADALYIRGFSYERNGEIENAIADYSSVITLDDAPIERVAEALCNRGVTYGQNEDTENAIADFSAVIALKNAPIKQVAKALNYRGATYGENGDIKNEIADYSAVLTLDDPPVKQVAHAFLWRGVTFSRRHSFENAESDFETLLNIESVSTEMISNAHLGLGEVKARKGMWSEAVSSLNIALQTGREATPRYVCDLGELIEILYEAGLSEQGMEGIVRELLEVVSSNEALGELGEHLVKHLVGISKAKTEFDPLWMKRWTETWRGAFKGIPELSITERMLRYGTEFLCSKERDESILNHLNIEERTLLRESLGLSSG